MLWNRLVLFVIGFYSIKHNSDCQGRHSRITFKVVPDIESLTLRRALLLSSSIRAVTARFNKFIHITHYLFY